MAKYKYERIECFNYNRTPEELAEYLNNNAVHGWRLQSLFRINETTFEILFERDGYAEVAQELLATTKAAPLEPESYNFPKITRLAAAKREKNNGRKPWWRKW